MSTPLVSLEADLFLVAVMVVLVLVDVMGCCLEDSLDELLADVLEEEVLVVSLLLSESLQ